MKLHTPTLVIGNGFAGRTVAHSLGEHCLIVERGEKFNIFERRQRFLKMEMGNRHDALIRQAYASRHAFNTPERPAADLASEYILVDGGCSNHWGGLSFRLSENVFSQTGDFAWPFSLQDMQPYYRQAEQMLRISADRKDPEERHPVAEISGAGKWHAALEPYFPAAYIGAQAHNLAPAPGNQGLCGGAGDCELCPLDAKTRSLHLRCEAPVLNSVMVDRLVFENGRAREAVCVTEDGPLHIKFDQVVVAAHGIESLKLLCKSELPAQVPRELLGHHYQDHAVAELACVLPGARLPFLEVNTAAQLVIPELSGTEDGLEYTTLALLTPPNTSTKAAALDLQKVNQWQLTEAVGEMGSVLSLYVLLEIPPEWDVSLAYVNGRMTADMRTYHSNKGRYDRVIDTINARLLAHGAIPLAAAERRHYRHAAGTHHLVGMLGMGNGPRSVVAPDFRLRGTDNVYIAGSALFPRCGSRNPTVTVVALALMLGERLNAERQHAAASDV